MGASISHEHILPLFCNLFDIFQGYNRKLHDIFEKAGYYLSNTVKDHISKQAVKTEEKKEKEDNGEFDSLFKCTKVKKNKMTV